MKILICPDSFKGTLSSAQAAQAIENGIKETLPKATTILHPIADGGEGTVEILTSALKGYFESTEVRDPLGRPVTARVGFASVERRRLAIIEAAQANGLNLLRPEERNPFLTSTFGVGEMIAYAQSRLPDTDSEILVGIGGSATNDGGVGMAQALGWEFLDREGNPLPFEKTGSCASSLESLDSITPPSAQFSKTKITVLSDVNNPLLGPTGASFVYARQKGASEADLPELERLLTRLRDIARQDLGIDMNAIKGGGAAGGLGAGLVTFLGAEIKAGLTEIAGLTGLEKQIQEADLVVTGEGKIDEQTEYDKGPYLIAKLAKKHGKKVIALCGFKAASPNIFDEVRGTNEHPDFDPKTIAASAATLLSILAKETIITNKH